MVWASIENHQTLSSWKSHEVCRWVSIVDICYGLITFSQAFWLLWPWSPSSAAAWPVYSSFSSSFQNSHHPHHHTLTPIPTSSPLLPPTLHPHRLPDQKGHRGYYHVLSDILPCWWMSAHWRLRLYYKSGTIVLDVLIRDVFFALVVALTFLLLFFLELLFFAGHNILNLYRTVYLYHWLILYLLKKHSILRSSPRVSFFRSLGFSKRSPMSIFGMQRSPY